jgi:ketosteroid isomerase-like protein
VAQQASMSAKKDQALEYIGAMFGGDVARMSAATTADFRWWFPPSGVKNHGLPDPLAGRDNAAKMLFDLGGGIIDRSHTKREVIHAVEEGDMVVLHLHVHARNAHGMPYDNRYAFIFRFENTLIADVWEFTDTVHANEAFAAKPA